MRAFLVAALLLVLVPAVLLANASAWALRTALDDVAFARTVGRALDTPALEAAVAARVSDAMIETIDAVPDRLAIVSRAVLGVDETPTRAEIDAALQPRVVAALRDPRVEAVRDEAVAATHRFVLDGATGSSEFVAVRGDQVVLDLSPLVERVIAAIDDRLPRAGLAVVDPADARLVLAEASALRTVARVVSIAETLQTVIPLAVLAVILLVVVLAHRRTRALGYAGLAIMLAGLASLGIAWAGGDVAGSAASDPLVGALVEDVYASLVGPLVLQSMAIVGAGALLALGAWVTLRRRRAG